MGAPGSGFVLSAVSIAIAFSDDASADEIAVFAEILGAIGDNLAIIAAQKELCKQTK